MGVLTDFVVASAADAGKVCASLCPSEEFAGLDAKGITTVNLGTLYAILTDSKFEPTFMGEAISSRGDEGPWVWEVPTDLVQRLANLDAKQLTSAGGKWAATEEFLPKYGHVPAEVVHQVLQELATMSKRAVAEGKSVLMWVCL
jgi:hypothetical protein